MPKVFHSRVLEFSAALILVSVFSGCASNSAPAVSPENGNSELLGKPVSNRANFLIATDFAGVLSQIRIVSPDKVTLNILPHDTGEDGFVDALRLALLDKSYAVRLSQYSASGMNLSIQIREQEQSEAVVSTNTTKGVARLYQISVGDISLRRRYLLQSSDRVLPLSTMEGRGFDGAMLVVDDSIFEIGEERLNADVSIASATKAESPLSKQDDIVVGSVVGVGKATILDSPLAVLPESTESVTQLKETDQVNPVVNVAAQRSLQSPPQQAFGSPSPERQIALEQTVNFKQLGKSNFYQFFNNSSAVNTLIIVFNNDSFELTPASRDTLQALVKNNLRPLDVISVVGTSHGRTSSEGAQKALSRDRTVNVVQALMSIGVDRSRIFAESSWSDSYYDEVMPRRGAVVEIRRAAPTAPAD